MLKLADAGAFFAAGTAVKGFRQNGQTVAAEKIPLPQLAQRIVISSVFRRHRYPKSTSEKFRLPSRNSQLNGQS
jgi:anti-sigma factor RsiW